MKDDAFQKSLRAFVRRRPFKPFVVELVSGDRIVIQHPEALAMNGTAAFYLNPDSEYAFFDSSTVSQLADISENGSKSARRRSSH
ncbi:MAG: hypothetical protein ACKV2Q_03590 [Planctomycetaceae bacterium]